MKYAMLFFKIIMTMKRVSDKLIKILSLGIGLAIGIVLIGKVCFELSYDGFFIEDAPGAKRPSYSINYGGETDDIVTRFSDVSISEETGSFYLTAVLDGKTKVRERLLALDAERYQKGDLPLGHLLGKYCTYLLKRK